MLFRSAIGARWDLLSQIGISGTDIFTAKQQFLGTLIRYYTFDDVSDAEVSDIARKYSRALSKHFAHTGRVEGGVDFVFLAVSTGIPLLVAGPVGIAIGVVLGVGGFATARLKVAHNLLWRLSAKNPKGWLKGLDPTEQDHAVSWFQLDPEKAATYLKRTSSFQAD